MNHCKIKKIGWISCALLLLCGSVLAGPPSNGIGNGGGNGNGNAQGARQGKSDSLAEVRQSTLKYMDVQAALDDGFISTVECDAAPHTGLPKQLGGQGIHFALVSEPLGVFTASEVNFQQPNVLIYVPEYASDPPCGYTTEELLQDQACRDSLRLVAVEQLMLAENWSGHPDNPPEFHDQQYYYLHDNPETDIDEAHGFPPHYELHLWLYDHNPAGLFAQYNPNVTCH